jgi:hypothetical protein
MLMNAKSELVHAIYHQLLVLSEAHGDHVQQIQFIARIITAPKPLWVIDLLGPFGFSASITWHHIIKISEWDILADRKICPRESRGGETRWCSPDIPYPSTT